MKFGIALLALEHGQKVTRTGWNGKGQFVYLVPADKYPAKTNAAKSIADENGLVSYRPYFALRTAQGDVSTWVPSVSDCLANDWEVLDTKREETKEEFKERKEKELDSFLTELAGVALLATILDKKPIDPKKCEKCPKKEECKRYQDYLKARKDKEHETKPKGKGGKK